MLACNAVLILLGKNQQASLGLVTNFFLSAAQTVDMHFSTPNSPIPFALEKDATAEYRRKTACSVPVATRQEIPEANRTSVLMGKREHVGIKLNRQC